MKKSLFLLSFLLILGGCSDKKESFVQFTNGVNQNKEILGDSQNYANFSGEVDSGDNVYLIDKESGLVHGTSKVKDNKFSISSNMQGLSETKLIITNDKDVTFPKVSDVSSLKNTIEVVYKPNPNFIENSQSTVDSNNQEQNDEKEIVSKSSDYYIGDEVTFSSGLVVTVNSVELTDEQPNNDLNGKFTKVNFTIDNQTEEEIDVSANLIELYDGGRNKATLDSKGFYSEKIAPGMKSTGDAYFDTQEEGPYTVIIGGGKWTSK